MGTLSQFGIAGVGTGYLAPKHRNRWRVTFSQIGRNGSSSSVNLSMQAINVTRPSVTFDEIQMDRYTTRAYVAGKYTWDQCNLTVEDDVNSLASKVIHDQIELQQRLLGADGPWINAAPTADGYKFGTKLTMLDGNEGVLEEWNLSGCFIVTANYNDLDYSASEAVRIDLSIRFDHAQQVFGDSGYGNALSFNMT